MRFAVFLTPSFFTSLTAVITRLELPAGVKVKMKPETARAHLAIFLVVDHQDGSMTMGKALAAVKSTCWTSVLPTTL